MLKENVVEDGTPVYPLVLEYSPDLLKDVQYFIVYLTYSLNYFLIKLLYNIPPY